MKNEERNEQKKVWIAFGLIMGYFIGGFMMCILIPLAFYYILLWLGIGSGTSAFINFLFSVVIAVVLIFSLITFKDKNVYPFTFMERW